MTTPPPTIDIYLTTQPYGLGAGEPVFELVINGVPRLYEAQVRVRQTLALLAGGAPGVTGVWISEGPWGSEGLDEAVFQITSDMRSVRATIPAAPAPTSGLTLGWIADASVLVSEKRSATDLSQALTRQLVVPLCTDLVVLDPHEDNVTPAHLDALMTFASIGGVQVAGYLGVPRRAPSPDQYDLFETGMYAAAKATGSWRVAVLGERPRVHLKTEMCA